MVNSPAAPLSERQSILLLAVAVIGLGNVWRLPSLILNHGGAAFLLVYAGCLLGLGLPLLMAELAYGRLAGARLGQATRDSVAGLKLSRAWLILCFSLPLAGVALITLYGALAGWSFGFVFRAASGLAQLDDPEQARTLFLDLASDPERSMLWHSLFWMCIGIISAQGWRNGLLRAARWFGGLMVLLALLLADALGRLAGEGILDGGFFAPRWSELGIAGLWAALTQACFTLTVGLGLIYVVGRRVDPQANLGRIGLSVLALDLGFSLLLGSAMATLVAPQGQMAGGVSLVFVDMVIALAPHRGLQIGFFCLLLVLSASSAMLLIEPFVQSVKSRFRCSRVAAASGVSVVAWLAGLLAIFSFGPWRDWSWGGRGLVEWLLYLGVNLLIPLNCLLLAGFVGRAMPPALVGAAVRTGLSTALIWYWLLRYPVRLVLILLILQSSGIMAAVLRFFAPMPT